MKIKIVLFIILLAVVNSCYQKSVNIELGGNYKLITSASRNDLTIVDENNIVAINGHILDYAIDSIYIVAAQLPRDSVPECTGTILGITQKESQLAFEKSTFRQYWVIDKTKESVFNEKTKTYSNIYGPFKRELYLHKRVEIGIPESLSSLVK